MLWSFVYAWIVVMNPCSMPNASSSTFAIGATQLVVHEALEMTLCVAGSYRSSLTPRTIVRSSPLAGRADHDLLRAGGDVLVRVLALR